LVAGPFFGPEDPRSFYIDVVAPSGDYLIKELAGAAPTARFFSKVLAEKDGTEFSLQDIPRAFVRPLTRPIHTKSEKYAKGRQGSPLFGIVVYFDHLEKRGGSLITSFLYTRALNEAFGGVDFQSIDYGHVQTPEGLHSRVLCEVTWDLPLVFVLQLTISGNTHETARLEVTMLLNTHSRTIPFVENPVFTWARNLAEGGG
jgi:hypothetical protein